MPVVLGKLEGTTNERVLDAIRYEASDMYQRRISSAEQVGAERVLQELLEFRPHWNEFETAFVNKIGLTLARTMSWTNPLAIFKRGMMTHGDTIEEYQVGLLRAHGFDPKRDYGPEMIYGRELPEVQSNFHSINRQVVYKVTVDRVILRRAFLKPEGISEYAAKLMASPIISDQVDEFKTMARLFQTYEEKGGFYKVHIDPVSVLSSGGPEAREALRVMQALSMNLEFMSTKYNAAHMEVAANSEDLVILATPEFIAALNVEALAAAFNIDRLNVKQRIIPINRDNFLLDPDGTGKPRGECVITTKDFFVVADTLMETTEAQNPVNMYVNHFFHHHQIASASRFVPAILLTTGPGTVDNVITTKINAITAIRVRDVDDNIVTSLNPGMLYQVEADFTTLTNGLPAEANAKDWFNYGIRFVVEGNSSARTYVSDTGAMQLSGVEVGIPGEVAADPHTLRIRAIVPPVSDEGPTLTTEVLINLSGVTSPVWPVPNP